MKKFQVFRYLRKFRYLILVVALLGSVLIYRYATSKQQYVASTVIEYTNKDAADGKTPSGADIDVNEIYSSSVISDVISDLKLDTNIDAVRSCCNVEEVIPDEEVERKDAILKKGDEYNYFPTQYKVTFVANSSKSEEYARDVLDSIISHYFQYYSKKYVEYAIVPNNTSNISTDKYDYLDCIEMMDASVTEVKNYLDGKASSHDIFRSSKTGYTFGDLSDQYDYISTTIIPKLYATIYNQRLVSDKEGLIKRYSDEFAGNTINVNNLTSQISQLETLTNQYADKIINANSDMGKYNFSQENSLIVNNVQEYNEQRDKETTYDDLIKKYVSLNSERGNYTASITHDNDVLSTFSGEDVSNDKDSEMASYVTKFIGVLQNQLDGMYSILLNTLNEFNEVVGAENISIRSSISAGESVNVKLYLIVAIILFLIIGGVGAIVLGRIGDFIEYYMYTNRATQLPNRNKCNLVIDDLSKNALPEEYSCVVLRLQSLRHLNTSRSRKNGDLALKQFGKIINGLKDSFGFVGYNDGDNFMALFENCTTARANTFISQLREDAAEVNESEGKDLIDFVSGIANSTDDDVYEVRKLISKAFANIGKQESADKKTEEAARDAAVMQEETKKDESDKNS